MVRNFLQLRLPFPGRECFLVQMIQSLSTPDISRPDSKELGVTVEGDGVSGVSLELDGIRTRLLRGLDQFDCLFERLAVVGR